MAALTKVEISSGELHFYIPIEVILNVEARGGTFDEDDEVHISNGREIADAVAQRYYRQDLTAEESAGNLGDRFRIVSIYANGMKVRSDEIGPTTYLSEEVDGPARLIRIASPSTLFYASYPITYMVYDEEMIVLFNGQSDDDTGDELSIVMSLHQLPSSSNVLELF